MFSPHHKLVAKTATLFLTDCV